MHSPPLSSLSGHERSNWYLIRRLLALAWRHRLGCVRVLVEQALLVVLALAQLGLTGLGIDFIRSLVDPSSGPAHWPLGFTHPSDWKPMATIGLIAGVVLAAAVVQALLRYRAAITMSNLVLRIVVDLRTAVYDKLQRLSFRFFDANQSGSIINRVAGDVQAVRMFVDGVVLQVLIVLLSLGVYLAYMFSLNVPLTLACLATTPLLWLAAIKFSRSCGRPTSRNSELIDQLVLTLSENIQGVHVVKGFGRAAGRDRQIRRPPIGRHAIRSTGSSGRISMFQPAMGFLTQINMVVLLGYGGYLVIQRQAAAGRPACSSLPTCCSSSPTRSARSRTSPTASRQPDRGRARVRDPRRAAGSGESAAAGRPAEDSRCRAVRACRFRLSCESASA